MAKTFLQSVNAVLKRVKIIAGDAGELNTLTDSGRQHDIDVATQVINEGIRELYGASDRGLPQEVASNTITLVQGQRDYSLQGDLVQLRFPLIDQTNGRYIYAHPDGYFGIRVQDPEQDDDGLPVYGAINPENGNLYLDRSPTSADAGTSYTYWYDKSLLLTNASDTMPFKDDIFWEMVPVWAELWKLERHGTFQSGVFRRHLANATRLATQKQVRASWSPR